MLFTFVEQVMKPWNPQRVREEVGALGKRALHTQRSEELWNDVTYVSDALFNTSVSGEANYVRKLPAEQLLRRSDLQPKSPQETKYFCFNPS